MMSFAQHGQGRPAALAVLPALILMLCTAGSIAAQAAPGVVEKGSFRFTYDERGISGLAHTRDPYGAAVVPVARRPGDPAPGGGRGGGRGRGRGPGNGTLTLSLSYRLGNEEWTELSTRGGEWSARPEDGVVVYSSADSDCRWWRLRRSGPTGRCSIGRSS